MPYKKRLMGVAALLSTLMFALVLWAQKSDLGEIDFPTSGAPEAQKHFVRGVLLLHSFEFDDAAEAFREAQRLDPDFAMAYWGEAMTYNHPLWRQQDRAAALEVLARLATTPGARIAKAPMEREKGYLRAVDVLYGSGDKKSRDLAYAEAMRRLSAAYPDDNEAAAFYALAILGTSDGERDIPTYMKAAAVAEEVFARNSRHPGAAHYLIHSYDDPIHAPLGLRAARVYAEIAPAATHALHMPSHIFVALGMWDDVVSSNEDSWAASDARAKRKGLPNSARSYHALHWLEYGYLQQGRYQHGRKMLAIIEADNRDSGTGQTRSYLADMRATYRIETRRWGDDATQIGVDVADLGLSTQATDLFATGFAAAKRGNVSRAEEALSTMKVKLQEANENTYADARAAGMIMTQELEAAISLAMGKQQRAVDLLKQATAAEDKMSYTYGPPEPVKPSHELFGEVLLELDRPTEAREQFELALSRAPKRALSLLGLARAAAGSGDQPMARGTYGGLRKIWRHADTELPELQEVRTALGRAN